MNSDFIQQSTFSIQHYSVFSPKRSIPPFSEPLGFELQRPPCHRQRVLEVLDALAAVGVGDDQIEAIARDERADFAAEMASLLGVEPDHEYSPWVRTMSVVRQFEGAKAGPIVSAAQARAARGSAF